MIQVEGSAVAEPSSEKGLGCSKNRKMPRVAAEDGEEWVAGDEVGWLGGQGTQGLEGRVIGWGFISGEREAAARDTPHFSGQCLPFWLQPTAFPLTV